MFVGYQAVGTLGRALIEGATEVKLFGEEIHVNAEIVRMPGISGHADNEGLMRWADAFKEKPKKVFVTHGDDQVCEVFAKRLENELGYSAVAPYSGTIVDLLSGEVLPGQPEDIRHKRKRKPEKLPVYMQDYLRPDSA